MADPEHKYAVSFTSDHQTYWVTRPDAVEADREAMAQAEAGCTNITIWTRRARVGFVVQMIEDTPHD